MARRRNRDSEVTDFLSSFMYGMQVGKAAQGAMNEAGAADAYAAGAQQTEISSGAEAMQGIDTAQANAEQMIADQYGRDTPEYYDGMRTMEANYDELRQAASATNLADRKAGFQLGDKVQDKAFTADERMAAGLRAKGDYLMGKRYGMEQGLKAQDQAQQMELRGLQRQAAQLEIDKASREAGYEQRYQEINKDVEGWRNRLMSEDKNERLKAWQEMSAKHSGSDWNGRTFSKVEGYGADGKLYAYVADPDSGKVMPVNLDDPAMTNKVLNSYAMHQMRGVSPKGMEKWMDFEKDQAREVGLQRRHEQTMTRYDEDRETRLEIARLQAQSRNGTNRFAIVPLTDGYKFDPNSGKFLDHQNKEVTDKDTINRLQKIGTESNKATGAADPKYREAVIGLGPKPVPQQGWFGSVANQQEVDDWKRQRRFLDEVYGVQSYDGGAFAMPIAPMKAPK